LISKDLLEKLAKLEHKQWMTWSKATAREVHQTRRSRWEKYWVPYKDLSEEVKEHDRKWARKILELPEIKRALKLEEENVKLREALGKAKQAIENAVELLKYHVPENHPDYHMAIYVLQDAKQALNPKPAAYITDDEDDGHPD